jgi:membrane-bound ClpP family serine protease
MIHADNGERLRSVTLEFVYWVVLAAGVAFLAVALLFDAQLARLPFKFPGAEVIAGPVSFVAAAVFGAAGLVGLLVYELGAASIFVAIGGALVVGGINAILFTLVKHRETIDMFDREKLVAMRGITTLGLGPNHVGRVSVQYAGMTRSLSATSDEEIKAGEEIVVLDVLDNLLFVARLRKAFTRHEVDA